MSGTSLPPPPFTLGPYELLETIGAGAYGTVYRAHRRGCARPLAVKLLSARDDDVGDLRERFLSEVRLLEQVQAPEVAAPIAGGEALGRYFVVMPFAAGEPLDQALALRGPLRPTAALRLGRDLCAAVTAVAGAGALHRDIKPANVVVREGGAATLVDFGLAIPISRREHERAMGTTPYLAPEVASGGAPHVGADLYSVGVTLWEALTAERPFAGETDEEVLSRIVTGVPALEVVTRRPETPLALSALIARLMEPDPAWRLDDPARAARAFDALLAERPYGARSMARSA